MVCMFTFDYITFFDRYIMNSLLGTFLFTLWKQKKEQKTKKKKKKKKKLL